MVNIGSGKGLLPVPCQAITWTSVNLLPIGPIITNFRKVLIKLLQFSFKKYIWICRLQNVIHFVQFSVCEAEVISLTHWGRVTHICISKLTIILPPASTKLKGGYTGITLSVCPSVDRIVSALYLQQYSSDPFHICTSYQATSEGVSRVMPV